MDDPPCVGGGKPCRDLDRVVERFAQGRGPSALLAARVCPSRSSDTT